MITVINNTMKKQRFYGTALGGDDIDNWVKIGEGAYAVVERGSFSGGAIVRKRMKQSMNSVSHDSAFYSEIAVLKSLPSHSAVVGYFGCEVKHNIG